jgi:hypothetical protein
MKIQELADEAQLFRRRAMLSYGRLPAAQLELIRTVCDDSNERKSIDWVLTERKRASKAEIERTLCKAEMFDKASMPAAAGAPTLVGVLISEQLISAAARPYWVLTACAVAALFWVYCRWKSVQLSTDARIAAANLGKVE